MQEREREAVESEVCSIGRDQTATISSCEQQEPGGKDGTDNAKKLDISSNQFDPLLALYSPEVPLPYPNVKCFNNLAEYESFMKGGRGRAKPENVEKKIRKSRRGLTDPERIERLKKLMLKNPTRDGDESESNRPAAKHKAPKNILTRMPLHEGSPLGELNRCVQHRLRVRVHIRSFKGLRGVCTGFVVAFDKFWNLIRNEIRRQSQTKPSQRRSDVNGEPGSSRIHSLLKVYVFIVDGSGIQCGFLLLQPIIFKAMVDVDETFREPLLGQAFYHEKALTVTRMFEKLQVQTAGEKAAKRETCKADKASAEPHSVTGRSSRASRKTAEGLTRCVENLTVTHTETACRSETGAEHRGKRSKARVEYGRVRTRHVKQLFIRGENVLLVNIQQ